MKNPPVITIDGPSGTGKGTLCHLVADALGWHFLDSGAIYRVCALAAKQHSVDLENEQALEVLAEHLDVQFTTATKYMGPKIILEGVDVTEEIRSEECGTNASKISAFLAVRTALLARQRAFRQAPGLVTDGRDMGTVVFPDAILKIYLTATTEERARRRYEQLKNKGLNVSLAGILHELQQRDARDQSRAVSPLKPADDAITIDTTEMSIDDVYEAILAQYQAVCA